VFAKKPRNERLEKAVHVEQESVQPDPATLFIERHTLAAEQQLYERDCRLVRSSAAVHRTPSFCHWRLVERLRRDRRLEDLTDPPDMPFQRAINCEIRGETETGEQYAIEQRVFAARVMHTWKCRLSALSDVEVACEVNSSARAGEVGANTFVFAVNATLEQFAGFGCELLDDQVLEAPRRRREICRPVKIEVSQTVGIAKKA
jgi:hypothetical protein